MLLEGLVRGAAGAAWDGNDDNNSGGATAEDKGLLLQIMAWADNEIQNYCA